MEKVPVAVLGATGTVGQKFISLLERHPYFTVTELVASPKSAGKPYREVCNWKQDTCMPEEVADLIVKTTEEALENAILFSGMDSIVAGPAEETYAHRGHVVISNSRNHRMDRDVPIIIPEVNPDHFEIVLSQPYRGAIVTNSNCSTMFLAMVLAPIHRAYGVESVQVTTMQAISGAGYPGVPSMDILGNVIPYIGGEEEKMETETRKILGSYSGGAITDANIAISAQCNRVPVFDGHTETLSLKLRRKASPAEIAEVLDSFIGIPQERCLPSAPEKPILVFEEADRPQPARDVLRNNAMSACVGRIRECPVSDIKMVILGHNTVRGAAGAAILNAESFIELGYMDLVQNKQDEPAFSRG